LAGTILVPGRILLTTRELFLFVSVLFSRENGLLRTNFMQPLRRAALLAPFGLA
jgi:hypothetical protein